MSNIVFLGNSCVGKSSIINRILYDLFITKNKTTIGCDFYSKHLIKNDINYRLLLWDTSCQQKFRNLTYLYIKKAIIIIIVYDITDMNSVNHIHSWIEEAKKNPNTNIILVGNKYDLNTSINLHPIINNIKSNFNINRVDFTISCKTGENMNKLVDYIINIIKNQPNNNTFLTNTIQHKHKCCI